MAFTHTEMYGRTGASVGSVLRHAYATGTGSISESLDLDYTVAILEIRLTIKTNPPSANNFTIDLNSRAGANYDLNLETQDMADDGDGNAVTDYHWILGDDSFVVDMDDTLDFAWTKPGADTLTWTLDVVYTLT